MAVAQYHCTAAAVCLLKVMTKPGGLYNCRLSLYLTCRQPPPQSFSDVARLADCRWAVPSLELTTATLCGTRLSGHPLPRAPAVHSHTNTHSPATETMFTFWPAVTRQRIQSPKCPRLALNSVMPHSINFGSSINLSTPSPSTSGLSLDVPVLLHPWMQHTFISSSQQTLLSIVIRLSVCVCLVNSIPKRSPRYRLSTFYVYPNTHTHKPHNTVIIIIISLSRKQLRPSNQIIKCEHKSSHSIYLPIVL